MINLLPFDDSRPLLGLRDGFYFKRQERGYGLQVTVVGAMPHTPEEFEQAVSRLMGTSYEITLAAGYEAPEGSNEQEFLRRGFWRMVFFPSATVHRAESNPTPPRRVRIVREEEQVRRPRRRGLHAALEVEHQQQMERQREARLIAQRAREQIERGRSGPVFVEGRVQPRNADGSLATISVGGMGPVWRPAEDGRGVLLRQRTSGDDHASISFQEEVWAFPNGAITPDILRQLQNDPRIFSVEYRHDPEVIQMPTGPTSFGSHGLVLTIRYRNRDIPF